VAEGKVRLPGSLRLDEASTWTGRAWRHPDVTTLGGYIVAHIGRIPRAGESVTLDGLAVTIERVENRAIASLVVSGGPDFPESPAGVRSPDGSPHS